MKLRYFVPLIGYLIPTVVIGYGVVIPRSGIAGVNDLTIGFAGSIVRAGLTYYFGLRTLAREYGPAPS